MSDFTENLVAPPVLSLAVVPKNAGFFMVSVSRGRKKMITLVFFAPSALLYLNFLSGELV
ncbi:MAG TPA: hypothetical protein ENG95_06320 [Nitrospirae bacterium]|nr:hypothetical protein [Nitrospirota bacterium]HDO26238.1 hypothetical protein [Nitrospirota bacterium]HDZ84769.1 hypothetical protein [Nitrospirota bacterium]